MFPSSTRSTSGHEDKQFGHQTLTLPTTGHTFKTICNLAEKNRPLWMLLHNSTPALSFLKFHEFLTTQRGSVHGAHHSPRHAAASHVATTEASYFIVRYTHQCSHAHKITQNFTVYSFSLLPHIAILLSNIYPQLSSKLYTLLSNRVY
jgi:hypothetical protein